MKKMVLLILIGMFILSSCDQQEKKPENDIIIYGDYKCPYCKKVEEEIMPKLKKEYIDTDKAKFKFVNMAFLGKDSIKGSRAGHAVQNVAPKQYLEFQNKIYSKQPNHEGRWITNSLLDKEISSLNISDEKKEKIKKSYKSKNSQSWKDAAKDIKLAKEKGVEEVPEVYINNKQINDTYNIKEYEKLLEK